MHGFREMWPKSSFCGYLLLRSEFASRKCCQRTMAWPEEEGKRSSFLGCCVGVADQLQLAVLRNLWLPWDQGVCLRAGDSRGPGALHMPLVGQKGALGLWGGDPQSARGWSRWILPLGASWPLTPTCWQEADVLSLLRMCFLITAVIRVTWMEPKLVQHCHFPSSVHFLSALVILSAESEVQDDP